jgi:negative regulator of flagellin synthesis FlgM
MNIDRVNQNLAAGAYGAKRSSRSGDAARAAEQGADLQSSGGAASTDGIDLSDQARLVSRATTAARNAPDVREQVVSELRQRIQDGSYQIDDQAVAQKLLDEAEGS